MATFMKASDARWLSSQRTPPMPKEVTNGLFRFVDRMIHTSASVCGKKMILIEVPTFIHGIPEFERSAAQVAIVAHYRQKGFYVQMVQEFILYISWRHSQ